jgi:acetyl-CoA synthetase
MGDIFQIGLGNNDIETRKRADSDFVSFWNDEAKKLSWFRSWDKTLDWSPPFAKWFVGGLLNASYNALDIHQKTKSEKPAILWEGENGESRILTYKQLWIEVQKFANALKSLGVHKGDRITIYLPMVPELLISMLACARIGTTHTVVFSGFSSSSLKDRIDDSKSKIVITADGGFRRGVLVKLKEVVDEAIKDFDFVKKIIILERAKNKITLNSNDILWSDLMKSSLPKCDAEKLESTHPLYIL